jgi:UDP-N-acetylmuramoylalanine--D-glutamate ligase
VAALEGFADRTGGVVLIAGGRDKGGAYDELRARMDAVGRGLVLVGEAADRIEAAFAGSRVPVSRATGLEEAVSVARAVARPGDAVLLAPACSSFDMFSSYAERGEVFQRAVAALGGDS